MFGRDDWFFLALAILMASFGIARIVDYFRFRHKQRSETDEVLSSIKYASVFVA